MAVIGLHGRTRLHQLTYLGGTNVLAHELILAGPVKVVAYCEIYFFTTTMSTNRCVMVLLHDTQSQMMIWYDDKRHVASISQILE